MWSVYNEKYFVQGDSLYGPYLYKKYFFTNHSVVTNGTFFALLREDSLTGQVFAIDRDSMQEHLLYDFSLILNDTVTVYPLVFAPYPGPVRVVVSQIDSILIGTNYRKRLKVMGVDQNTYYDEYWIQGIGSTFGPFYSGITGIEIFDIYYPELLCIEQDSLVLYDNPGYPDCYEPYPTGIKKIEDRPTVKIFPNPGKGLVFITADYELSGLTVSAINGQDIKKETINGKSYRIDISDLPAGIYFVAINAKGTNPMRKIIKILCVE